MQVRILSWLPNQEEEMKKTGRKWGTEKCGRCGEPHSGKLDAKGIEYVVCGLTHKRMNVADKDLFPTNWIEE